MKKSLLYIMLLCISATAFAQQPSKVTAKWFADPVDVKMDIPVFAKKKGFTSHKEMLEFLNQLASKYPQLIKVEKVGETQKGREIPLVTIRKGNDNSKLRIFATGRIHGNEPSGTEGLLYFIKQLAEDKDVAQLLNKIDFYIMPMINADGAEAFKRRTANDIDLNRDQSKLDTPEAVAFHAVANRVNQHVYVDLHEFQPIRTQYSEFNGNVLSIPWDVMFLYSSNPNVPASIRNSVDNLFLPELSKAMDQRGYTHTTYYTPKEDNEGMIFNVGGSSARSTSNAMALRNSISLLMETRGINLDRISTLRRAHTAYTAMLSIARTAFNNEETVRNVLKEGIQDRSDISVKFSSKKVKEPMLFLDLMKNDTLSIVVRKSKSPLFKVTATLPLPEYYYILPTEKRAIELLGKMGIEHSFLKEAQTVDAQYYTVTKLVSDGTDVGGVIPVKATVEINQKEVTFPAGTAVVSTHQKNVRSATVLLEPEASNGFVNFKVIKAAEGKELPVYRVNK